MIRQIGQVVWVNGPVVRARGSQQVGMLEVVEIGDEHLVGEVIGLERDIITIQVYEETSGLRPGTPVFGTGLPLSVELGPGLLQSIFDGIQRPLPVLELRSGAFIGRGIKTTPLYRKQKWAFTPRVEAGVEVHSGDILGTVPETPLIEHRIMVPPDLEGKLTWVAPAGEYTVEEPIARLETEAGEQEITMLQRWPVRRPRTYLRRLPPTEMLVTGQRVLDTFFPLVKGGAAGIPGGFGSGKCVTGDTLVLLGDGTLRPIAELYAEYSEQGRKVSQGIESYTYLNKPLTVFSLEDGVLAPRDADVVYKGKADQVICITTRSGRTVKVTPVHRLFTVTPDLEIREVAAQYLNVGDYLAVPRKIETRGKPPVLDYTGMFEEERVCDPTILESLSTMVDRIAVQEGVSWEKIASKLGCSAECLYAYCSQHNRPPVWFVRKLYAMAGQSVQITRICAEHGGQDILRLPGVFDGDAAEFLGYLLSDGDIEPERSSVCISNVDADILDRVERLAERLFGLQGKRRVTRRVTVLEFACKPLLELLQSWEVPFHNKTFLCRVPALVARSPDEHVARFLSAYFMGDGHFKRSNHELGFTTASRDMLMGLSYLLTRLGIVHRLREDRSASGRPLYRIFIYSKENIRLFYDWCAPQGWSQKKFKLMKQYLGDERSGFDATDVVPVSTQWIRAVYEGMGKPYKQLRERNICISNYLSPRQTKMSASVFKRFAEFSQVPQFLDFARILDQVLCDPIVRIERVPGLQDVYDLSVPQTHNFVGGMGPMVLHNTITQHQIAKWSDADVVIYIGCGERGNELTEVLQEFPHLTDPRSGRPLMERTILVANTSNMPVAAREASIYTGITLAEYYRDMGYDVALMADSTSRWAEALREISGRLEEMPAEEGYPAYLGARLAEFYERAGRVTTLGGRTGSVSIIGAVSPPGGDFSEPVTQQTNRFIRCFWALDKNLSSARHFPAVNWLESYSEYVDLIEDWWRERGLEEWHALRERALEILQREDRLQQIVKLVGPDALPDDQRLILETARLLREGFLQQNALDPVDSYAPVEKQIRMLETILHFHERARRVIAKGCPIVVVHELPVVPLLVRMKTTVPNDQLERIAEICQALDEQMDELERTYL